MMIKFWNNEDENLTYKCTSKNIQTDLLGFERSRTLSKWRLVHEDSSTRPALAIGDDDTRSLSLCAGGRSTVRSTRPSCRCAHVTSPPTVLHLSWPPSWRSITSHAAWVQRGWPLPRLDHHHRRSRRRKRFALDWRYGWRRCVPPTSDYDARRGLTPLSYWFTAIQSGYPSPKWFLRSWNFFVRTVEYFRCLV